MRRTPPNLRAVGSSSRDRKMARGGSPTSKNSKHLGTRINNESRKGAKDAKGKALSVRNVKLQELSVISVQTAKRQAFISAELKVLSTEPRNYRNTVGRQQRTALRTLCALRYAPCCDYAIIFRFVPANAPSPSYVTWRSGCLYPRRSFSH